MPLASSVLVGRDRELAQLQAYLAIALDGGGNPLLVAGEEGIGKSRLLSEPHVTSCVVPPGDQLSDQARRPYPSHGLR